VHSERTPAGLRASGSRISGLQTWVALPLASEEDPPSFSHHENPPVWEEGGIRLRLILGDIPALASPVPTLSPMVYADVSIAATRRFAVPIGHEQRAIFVVEGSVEIDSQVIGTGEFAVLETGADVPVFARERARVMLLGGAPLDAPRFVWWNFVSSRRDRIGQAADDWKAGRFARVPGEDDFIPLPENLHLRDKP
jgi:redox-sensitive bicupin YhaK (pirin superfamily)